MINKQMFDAIRIEQMFGCVKWKFREGGEMDAEESMGEDKKRSIINYTDNTSCGLYLHKLSNICHSEGKI